MTDIIKLAREAAKGRLANTEIESKSLVGIDEIRRFAELATAPLKAENEALMADAERYRWLVSRHFLGVNNHLPYIAQYPSPESHGIVQMVIEGPDAAIDAARVKE